jgi:ubiquinone/menaquinone biosynthesis C-methylase UbiE
MESVKKFWNSRPCNIRHGTAEVGSKEYFEQVEHRKYFVESHIPGFAEFEKWKGLKVLEIGTGIGTDTINFMKAGAEVTGIDLSEESVKLTKKRAEVYGFDPESISVANAEEFNFDTKFDLVYSFGVIHHTPNPRAVIERIAQHQDKGQELRIMLYSKVSYKLFWAMHTQDRWDLSKMNDTIREFAEAQTGCPVAYTYTFDEIRELLSPWYEVYDIQKDHIFKWDVEKYIKHEYEIDEAWKNVSDCDFRALEKELGWHSLVKAIKK